VCTFFLGLGAAAWVARIRSRAVRVVLDGLFTLPLVLPPTVAGFFLLLIFGVKGPVGGLFLNMFGFKIAFSWPATVLASITAAFPLMYRSSLAALQQVNKDLLDDGRTLGMSEWSVFWRIAIPTVFPGIGAGTVLAFARGMGEFGATSMIAGNIAGKTRTAPLAIYSAIAAGDTATAGGYVLVLMAVSFAVIALLNWFTIMQKK
jgi:molybdate transport system permease protein